VFEGTAADSKGPLSPATPEGYVHFYLLLDLRADAVFVVLCKSLSEWQSIFPDYERKAQAKMGLARAMVYLILDGQRVHSSSIMEEFYSERGIELQTTAPHSQWQNPAERAIQTIWNMVVTSIIHGGGP
jgi:hypothetical protein